MNKYATTITLGSFRKLYIPFEVGVGTNLQRIGQVALLGHECTHAWQSKKDRFFAVKYLASDTQRAFYEMEALRAEMELWYFLTGKIYKTPTVLANGLANYSIGAADRLTVKEHLTAHRKVVEAGGVYTKTAKDIIKWLKK